MIDDHAGFHDVNIAATMNANVCPACDYLQDVYLSFFVDWLSDLTEKEEARKDNALSYGLCPFHTWQMETMGSSLGISKGLSPLMRRIADELQEVAKTQTKASSVLGGFINDSEKCRICRFVQTETSIYLVNLEKFLLFQDNRRLYETSGGLCLRHLYDMTKIADPQEIQFLSAFAAKHFAEIAADMDHYSEKRRSSQKHLLTDAEKKAYLRGLSFTVGHRLISGVPPSSVLRAPLDSRKGKFFYGGSE
jgi:hypothetical protein